MSVHNHASHGEGFAIAASPPLITNGLFASRGTEQFQQAGLAMTPLSFHVDLFGKSESSRILHITASQKSENLRHKFQLTPEQPVGLLFPSEGRN